MKTKDKRKLLRIIISAAALAAISVLYNLGTIPDILKIGNFLLLPLLLYLLPYFIIGYDILRRAIINIFHGQILDENFLMSIATAGAFIIGEYSEAVFVMLFYQVGELFQSIAVGKSRKSIKSLLSIRADTAFVLREGEICEIACENIEIGEIIVIRPGEKIPIDATVIEGNSSIDTTALTGESIPREVMAGDSLLGGCVNCGGVLKAKVTKRFEESTVSKILSLVESAAENKSKSENFITKFARYYTPVVVIAAAALAVIPPLFLGIGNFAVWKDWVYRAMTFLVISCPCALVISVPLSYFSGIGSASAKGILIKGSNYLDTLADCDTVVFDKTGTLTQGVFEVDEICPAQNIEQPELSEIAAKAEKFSNHPISLSIKRACGKCIDHADVRDVEEIFGHGVKANVDGKITLAGNHKLMNKYGIDIPQIESHGTIVHIAQDGVYLGYILISDKEKPNARDSIDKIKRAGIKKTVMLTGDRQNVGVYIANKLNIDECYTDLLPTDKVEVMESLLSEKQGKVAFVGDGINDAPVLARADIGISMGALGSDAAIEASDIVLMDDKLENISKAILLSRRTRRIVIENIVFALGIKAAVLILGALGIVGLNAAVFADVGVAVLAILNSMRNLKK